MNGVGDSQMTDAVSGLILDELSETIDSCQACVIQVGEFMKVANCILTRDEFFGFLMKYKKFDSNLSILENLAGQLDEPMNILQAMSLKATMKELKKGFDDIVFILNLANDRIDSSDVDLNMAKLIQRLLKLDDFDAIHFDGLENAMNSTFLIYKVIDVVDENFEECYYPFNYLQIYSFNDKISAYQYALKNGLSKSRIINRFN